MAPKAKTPAPIDRPLSRSYLREFSGWSTAFPPGLSEPTSLRVMENIQINRDGSARVRPGLRYLSYATLPVARTAGTGVDVQLVGTHEVFFLGDGTTAYLFAVREPTGAVGFRVLASTALGPVVKTLAEAGFELPQGYQALPFSERTTYVKYLQIDNKIFALSNAGEPMRLFHVGTAKSARRLGAITRPDWTISDKLRVVHPDATWVNSTAQADTRINWVPNPSAEKSTSTWTTLGRAKLGRVAGGLSGGQYTFTLQSLPRRTNLMTDPLHNVPAYGITGWTAGAGVSTVAGSGGWLRATAAAGAAARLAYVNGPLMDVSAGQTYQVSWEYSVPTHLAGMRWLYRWYNSANVQLGSDLITRMEYGDGRGRLTATIGPAPTGAVRLRLFAGFEIPQAAALPGLGLRAVMVTPYGEGGDFFTGDSPALEDDPENYFFWTGTPGASPSVYHPPQLIGAECRDISYFGLLENGETTWATLQLRSSGPSRAAWIGLNWFDAAGSLLHVDSSGQVNDTTDWSRLTLRTDSRLDSAPALQLQIIGVARGETHYFDQVLLEQTDAAADVPDYFDGSFDDSPDLTYSWLSTEHESFSYAVTWSSGLSAPSAETTTTATLISSSAAANVYNFGFFYTFSNEIGESAPSQTTVVRTQRGWSAWRWETPNSQGEPSGISTTDPAKAADQLVAVVPPGVFENAIAQGATAWHLYAFTWSDQDPVPVTALRVATRELSPTSVYGASGWLRTGPAGSDAGAEIAPIPSAATRRNYSDPSRAGQGLVASDRMILVYDPADAAVIRWSSNQQGSYTDFTASRGGGYKTLTSGNLYVPACVKLWQNPQSVDTLTVLCLGVDGRSTAYYMAPATVASQSEQSAIMGFEETSNTAGTTSPYGVEVFNNALYRPLDEQLMKSTANNYNISHKTQTEQIRDRWERLDDKANIVSSQHDGRLYYVVHNPDGERLEPGCRGNEIWVFDASSEAGTWSRWLVQAISLRKIEKDGRAYMSVIRPDGIYYLDPDYGLDDVVEAATRQVVTRPIRFRLETNTQGANRAHDAWAHLQQLNLTVGNFQGQMRYGIRSHDLNGKRVEVAKDLRSSQAGGGVDSYDLEDYLLVRRDLKEWVFFAESVVDESGVVQPCSGQVNLVQYRYTPVSVNVGYEYGSVETFEYQRSGDASALRTTDSGVPQPMIDSGRP